LKNNYKKYPLTIQNSTIEDIDNIFSLYRIATEYQKDKFPDNQWPEFDREMVMSEIKDSRQWKMVIDNKIACIWAITFNDPEIWEDRDNDPSIYIHRIATNPEFRGHKFVSQIVDWAKLYAKAKDKKYIRLDTCGYNTKLIEHYKTSGFNFLGIWKLKNYEGLPSHYHNADVCFFEIEL
jgi:ribosomal protein S18 acetylase RimI-like enzyme